MKFIIQPLIKKLKNISKCRWYFEKSGQRHTKDCILDLISNKAFYDSYDILHWGDHFVDGPLIKGHQIFFIDPLLRISENLI
jgi:hypothetical protein